MLVLDLTGNGFEMDSAACSDGGPASPGFFDNSTLLYSGIVIEANAHRNEDNKKEGDFLGKAPTWKQNIVR